MTKTLFNRSLYYLIMRPKKFGVKPLKTNPERFRRTTRVTPRIKAIASSFKGTNEAKAWQIIEFVMKQRPYNTEQPASNKKVLFRKNADRLAAKVEPADVLHCAERCTLALALLNASGIPAWLARQISLRRGIERAEFHDYVELFINGKVHTMIFQNKFGTLYSGTAKTNVHERQGIFYRAADLKQISGIDSSKKYEEFRKKFVKNFSKELEKNDTRMRRLVSEQIIPSEAYHQILMEG
jgi:hypothetical protein